MCIDDLFVNQSNICIPNTERWKLFSISLYVFFRLWLKREKTEHNVIKVACTEHFDWLMKFPEMDITKVFCTWLTTGRCQMFLRKYNEQLYFKQIDFTAKNVIKYIFHTHNEDTIKSTSVSFSHSSCIRVTIVRQYNNFGLREWFTINIRLTIFMICSHQIINGMIVSDYDLRSILQTNTLHDNRCTNC